MRAAHISMCATRAAPSWACAASRRPPKRVNSNTILPKVKSTPKRDPVYNVYMHILRSLQPPAPRASGTAHAPGRGKPPSARALERALERRLSPPAAATRAGVALGYARPAACPTGVECRRVKTRGRIRSNSIARQTPQRTRGSGDEPSPADVAVYCILRCSWKRPWPRTAQQHPITPAA